MIHKQAYLKVRASHPNRQIDCLMVLQMKQSVQRLQHHGGIRHPRRIKTRSPPSLCIISSLADTVSLLIQSKPLTIQRQNMESLLNGSRSPSPTPNQPTHVQEQQALRDETINAFHHAVSEQEDDDLEGGLLTLREKTKDELERQEEEYRAYLEREVGDVKSLVYLEEDVKDTSGKPSISMKDEGRIRKRSGKRKARKEETDQEFLLKYVRMVTCHTELC